jgi:CheY-like chemotaxis protein
MSAQAPTGASVLSLPRGTGGPSELLKGLKIVVVENHKVLLGHIGVFLGQCGANVVLAENGVQGLEVIKDNRPHVVVSDILMESVDGFEMLRQIRELGPKRGGNVPVIAITVLVRQADRIRNAGFQACLFKPFTPDELLEEIRLLDPRKNIPPDLQRKRIRSSQKWERSDPRNRTSRALSSSTGVVHRGPVA